MIDLRLPYNAPYDWVRTLRFLTARSTKGVELVRDDAYLRTVRLGDRTGWLRARHDAGNDGLLVDIAPSLADITDALRGKLRHLFDLDARPEIVTAHFAKNALLRDAVRRRPGLRVPGAFDGFELAARAILGQQITVKAATTIAGRFAAAFGYAIDTPHAELTHLTPTAARMASASVDDIAKLGIIQTRARSIIAVAQEIDSGRLTLEPGAPVDATRSAASPRRALSSSRYRGGHGAATRRCICGVPQARSTALPRRNSRQCGGTVVVVEPSGFVTVTEPSGFGTGGGSFVPSTAEVSGSGVGSVVGSDVSGWCLIPIRIAYWRRRGRWQSRRTMARLSSAPSRAPSSVGSLHPAAASALPPMRSSRQRCATPFALRTRLRR
ncbi:MAG: DNA-3-methyladenine glycosylase 2 [Gemmatimonadaceae bacterium]